MKRVKKLGVYQTSKVAAVIFFLLSLVIILPVSLIANTFNHMGPNQGFPGFPFGGTIFFILLPLLYALFGFITTAISCVVYNLVAKWTGGIELEFETMDE